MIGLQLRRDGGVAVLRGGTLDLVEIGLLGLLGAARPAEVLGKQLSALVHPADRRRLLRELDAATASEEPVPFEVDLLRLDGGAARVRVVIGQLRTADDRCLVQLCATAVRPIEP